MNSTIISKQLVLICDVETILEDNLPQYTVEVSVTTHDVAATFRVRKSTNIGAEIALSVYSFDFGPKRLRNLRETDIEASLIDALQQSTDETPIPADHLKSRLRQAVGSANAKELLSRHRSAIERVCGVDSLITITDWDPHSWAGALTGGSAWHTPNRGEFVKQLFTLLTDKIEHSSSQCDKCFVATAASGNADDPNVVILRRFRDDWLAHNRPGRLAIRFYNTLGPRLAKVISRSWFVRRVTYILCVRPVAHLVSILGNAEVVDAERKD